MMHRRLGQTGEQVSAIGVGGWHLGLEKVAEQTAIRIVRSALDEGINFLDNSWDYNEGASAHYRSFGKEVLPELTRRDIGVLGMKSMANGILLKSNTVTPIECLHYALNLPTSVVITGIDSLEILDQALEAVRTFHPLTNQEIDALLAKTAKAAANGQYEPFKTTSIFDSTATNPEWLGEEPERVQQLMPA